jgi:DNA-binding transcriptional regulator YbjK
MNPPRGNADARRAVILDAALRVFGQYGYRRTSMDDIAREKPPPPGSWTWNRPASRRTPPLSC